MKPPAAIQAQIVDMKNVATHKVFRLFVDVPAEQAQTVIDTFGWATAVNPIAVAVARIDLSKALAVAADKPSTEVRRDWRALPPAQQCGIRCNEALFWRFLGERDGTDIADADAAASILRSLCGVKSRAEFATNKEAAERWARLDDEFWFWQREAAA